MTIKPTAAIFWVAMLIWLLRELNQSVRMRATLLSVAGFLAAPLVAVGFLAHWGAMGAFWRIATGLIPFHNQLVRRPMSYLLLHPLPSSLMPVLVIWAVVLVLRRRAGERLLRPEESLAAIGFLCGLASFFVQRKALPYHRYPADAFFLLLMALSFGRSLREAGWERWAGAVGILAMGLLVAPQCLIKTLPLHAVPNDFSGLLQRDLTEMGGASLDGRIECLDFTSGCVTTLYRMRVEESTGFLYDCYLFEPVTNAVVRGYRERFWRELASRPPEVIVLSNQDCERRAGFDKIDRWPELAEWLRRKYRVEKEVTPPEKVRWASTVVDSASYRIYARR
jgi:hypothetical protein